MAVYRRGYRRYQGRITGPFTRFMVLPRFSWQRLFQQRLVVLLMAVAMIWPLLCAGFIYLTNNAELLKGLDSSFRDFIQVNGRFFIVFMNVQSVFAMFLAALTGPGLIAPDLANNGLPLYFSRPLTRSAYTLARLLVLVGMLSLVTWIPGLLLFGMQVGMAGGGWFRANWTFGYAIVAGFAVWVLLVSLVALAGSAWVRWKVVAGALVLGFFFILAGISVMVNSVFRVDWGHALNPAWATYRLWCGMLQVEPPEGPGVLPCALTLGVIALLLALVLERRVRAVEVIS